MPNVNEFSLMPFQHFFALPLQLPVARHVDPRLASKVLD